MTAPRPALGPNAPGSSVIESLGVYLPPKVVSTKEVLEGCRNPLRIPFERLTGIAQRRMAGETEFALDLAVKAAGECLARSRRSAAEVDLVISASISRCDGTNLAVYEPSLAVQLKQRLGLSRAVAFDLMNACAGVFTAMKVADAMIKSGQIECALVVSGEYITHLTRTAQAEIDGTIDERLACLTLGDAGAAVMLVRARDRHGFHAIDVTTIAEHCNLCVATPTDRPHGGAIMRTDMVNLTAVGFEHGNAHALPVLERAGWGLGDVRHLIVHQTSSRSIEGAARELERRVGREVWSRVNMVDNLARRGNTATTTHMVALNDRIGSGEIADGENVLFGIFASGVTVGTALYALDDLPSRMRAGKPDAAASPVAASAHSVSPACPGVADVVVTGVGATSEASGAPSSVEMAARAARRCLDESRVPLDSIDLLIYTGVYRDAFLGEPAMATLVARRLGLGKLPPGRILAFDLTNGGLGVLNACHAGVGLIRSGDFRRVLVVASEIENNRGSCSAARRGIEEMATALLLEAAPGAGSGFGQFAFHYDPARVASFTSRMAQRDGQTYLEFAQDPDLESIYLDAAQAAFEEVVRSAGLSRERIALVLPPQLSAGFVGALRDRLGLAHDRVVDCASRHALFTSSLGQTLKQVRETRAAKPGDIGVLLAVAAGAQAGAAVYHF